MTAPEDYSGVDYWDDYHATGIPVNLNNQTHERIWLDCFIPVLEEVRGGRILDLGCGSGKGALELGGKGFAVAGMDISRVAIAHARNRAAREGVSVRFQQGDIAKPLPFPESSFDAVISNLTLHMFSKAVANRVVAECHRCLRKGGLLLCHVNSTLDIPFRTKRQAPAVELGGNFYRLGKGQTMRFYSESACRDLVAGWTLRQLEHVQAKRPDGEVQKCAWRCVAQKP
jgi:SAM-dependent methyltransferase